MWVKSIILVIGQNVERQIIDLDDQAAVLDENNQTWVDVCFDNRTLPATQLKRQFSQLSVLTRVLKLLDYQVLTNAQPRDYTSRIVLRVNQALKVIRLGRYDDVLWERPEFTPKILVLLDSVCLSDYALQSVLDYLREFPSVKLIIEYSHYLQASRVGRELIEGADLVWADLLSSQTGETENLLNQFAFKNQLLLINHQAGLSLSDRYRTYKLTNADYLELRPLEWLAIAIKTLHYQFDIEDQLSLIARIGQTIARNNQVKLELKQPVDRNPDIELVRGEADVNKQMIFLAKQFHSRDNSVGFNLTNLNFNLVRGVLMVRDLPKHSQGVVVGFRHYTELKKRYNQLLEKDVLIACDVPTYICQLTDSQTETITRPNNFDIALSYIKAKQVPFLHLSSAFYLGQSTPTASAIATNVNVMVEFIRSCLDQAIVPVLEIKTVAQSTFDNRPGSVAVDLLRIMTQLWEQININRIDPRQVVVRVSLPQPWRQLATLEMVESWIKTTQQRLKQNYINFDNLSFGAELSLEDMVTLQAKSLDLYCGQTNFKPLVEVPMSEDVFRIKLSQFLVEL